MKFLVPLIVTDDRQSVEESVVNLTNIFAQIKSQTGITLTLMTKSIVNVTTTEVVKETK